MTPALQVRFADLAYWSGAVSVRPVDAVGKALLALIECANWVPFSLSGYNAFGIRRVVPVPGLIGLAITSRRCHDRLKLISSAKPAKFDAANIGVWDFRYSSPCVVTAQTICAILSAMATVASRTGFRASKSTSRGSMDAGLCRARRTSDVAPTTSGLRRYSRPSW
jgi:hypothetical protein